MFRITRLIFVIICFFSLLLEVAGQNGEWTWMKGDIVPNSIGVSGVKGVPDNGNNPSGRYVAAQWTDSVGNFWIYGGNFFGGSLSDLWRYDRATNEWTWMHGVAAPTFGDKPVMGQMGIANPANHPGAMLYGTMTFTDQMSGFWLFGGRGVDSVGGYGNLQSFWHYNPGTNEWTWISGSPFADVPGVYGDSMVSSPQNHPPPRYETSATWTDDAGNLWMFGGQIFGSTYLNDMWRYDIGSGEWTWMHGDTLDGSASYGSLGVFSPINFPGGRFVYAHWKDTQGYLWIFGGMGRDKNDSLGMLNDLWKYDPDPLRSTFNHWAWMGGGDTIDSPGIYPPKCAVTDSAWPSPRHENRSCWTDSCGFLWMYGGVGNVAGSAGPSDLWKYNVFTNRWIWAHGDSTLDLAPTYGIQGVSDPSNLPGLRSGSPGWQDETGFWLFGGRKWFPASQSYNDLWRFIPDSSCSEQLTITAMEDTIVCEGESIQLSVTGSNFVLWSPSNFLDNPNILDPVSQPDSTIVYHVTVPGNTCYQNDSVVIIVQSKLELGLQDSLLCVGDTLLLDAGNPGYEYLWHSSETTQSISIFPTDSADVEVFLEVTSPAGCVSRDTAIYSFQFSPVKLLSDTEICDNDTLLLDAGNSGATYLWMNGATSQNISVNDSGLFIVNISFGSGLCAVSDSSLVTVYPLPLVLLSDTSICDDTNLVLDAGNPGASYTWSTGVATQSILVDSTGTYVVLVTDSNSCKTRDTAIVVVHQSPSLDLITPSFCDGDTVMLCAMLDSVIYSWCDGMTSDCILISDTGNYCLEITDVNGCRAMDSVDVIQQNIYSIPLAIAWPDTTIFQDETVQIFGNGGTICSWNPATGLNDPTVCDPLASPAQTTTYILTIISADGCVGQDSVTITVNEIDYTVFIPNIFSPNKDGLNDMFKVEGAYIKELRLDIFNRWGENIFSSVDQKETWDGKGNNRDLNAEAFVYVVDIEFLDGSNTRLTGNVVLIK